MTPADLAELLKSTAAAVLAEHDLDVTALPEVVDAVARAAARGMSFGAPTALELEMAEALTQALPSIEQVRLVSSGTEAVMSALRVARAFTSREKILKFQGLYHGFHDYALINVMSKPEMIGKKDPMSAGMLAEVAKSLVRPVYLLELEFDSGTVRYTDAAMNITWGGHTYDRTAGLLSFSGVSETGDLLVNQILFLLLAVSQIHFCKFNLP